MVSLLHRLLSDPIQIYYLNNKLQIIIIPIIFYILLRCYNIPNIYALISSFLLLISSGNIFSMALEKDTRFRDDSEWRCFLENNSYYGFKKIEIPNTDNILYMKEDLIPQKR